jgi:hypothetical protein
MVIPLVFWLIVLFVFSLGGHTDTYRTVASGRGAFELCLPSLGNLYQNRMLWCENIHRTPKTSRVWGPGLVGHRVYLCNGMWVCNIMRFCRWVYGSVLRTSVSDYFLLSVFRRYRAYASRPTIRMRNIVVAIIVCVFNSAAGKCW